MEALLAGRLEDELHDAFKAIDRIEERLAFVTDPDELGDALLVSVELQNRANALVGRLGLAAQVSGTAVLAGQRSIGRYVAARTNRRASDIDRMVRRARWLRDFDLFENAHGAELTDLHVDHLKKNCDVDFDMHRLLVADQAIFVDAAANCSFQGFVAAVEYWKVHVDPDGKEPIDQIDKAKLSIRKGSGGRGIIDGECDAVTRLELETAIEHEADKLRRQDKADDVDRTDSQRRMAALAALVKRGFARQDGTMPGPLGNIVMSEKVAAWAIGQLGGTNTADEAALVPVHATDVDGRCELIDGTPIHPFLAIAALGLIGPSGAVNPVTLRRYILDADSRLLDVSVNARRFPEWMRTAIHVQARGRCESHGCDCPFHWLETDHVEPAAAGGPTCTDNGQNQCRPENHAKGASTGHTPWREKPPPKRHRPRPRGSTNDPDADEPDDTRF